MPPTSPLSLETTSASLGWPEPSQIVDPPGAAASLFAKQVRDKIGQPLKRQSNKTDFRLGVLMEDPHAQTSQPPLAIVAEATSDIDPLLLRELHRLAWNFSHVPTVITVEPDLLRAWTCCEAPDPSREIEDYLVESLSADHFDTLPTASSATPDPQSLHWVNLVSGSFFEDRETRFARNGRADRLLMANLRFMRSELTRKGPIDDDICHDLIARVIFVQFLFDRKDADGRAALNQDMLERLHSDGVLSRAYSSFAEILLSHEDTYRLFAWLNSKFNGDLFPGSDDSDPVHNGGWSRELDVVTLDHLALLSAFIRGEVTMPDDQLCLWPQYAFDVIPLEFISTIYETFVGDAAASDGVYYTPPYLVDVVLDQVLPWNDTRWDISVLDPACGSGVFLVKSFQRLVYRWKLAHPTQSLRATVLRSLLERNIFGVDKDPHAVRVTSFSLYLAMCDEIEPRHYWTQVKFPSMRQRRLICSDFFVDGVPGFDASSDARSYDLVVGNAPFGANVITNDARRWANSEARRWTIPNKDIGGLFLAKASELARDNGVVAMIQSANTILFNIGSAAATFRKQLFTTYRVDAVFNLSALRYRVFKGSKSKPSTVAPVCIVYMRPEEPRPDDEILFVSPKFVRPLVDDFTIVIEPGDRRSLTVQRAIEDPHVWSELMWATPRDLELIRRLRTYPTLRQLESNGNANSRVGIVYGDRKRVSTQYEGRRLFEAPAFPEDDLIRLDAEGLRTIREIEVHSRESTSTHAFNYPQLILKLSWTKRTGRFQARVPYSSDRAGVMCNQSYVSVHADESALCAAAVAFNSKIAVYLSFLTSGRFAAYRPKLAAREVLDVPLSLPGPTFTTPIRTYSDIDSMAFELFDLKDSERVLVEDAIDYTLSDFREGDQSLGREPTAKSAGERKNDSHLRSYCEYFVRVLKAGFGDDRSISANIFRSDVSQVSGRAPYRLVSFVLGGTRSEDITFNDLDRSALFRILHRVWNAQSHGPTMVHRRVMRAYEVTNGLPTILIMKPDQKRFWTRSMGLQDGDDVALDLFMWQRDSGEGDGPTVH